MTDSPAYPPVSFFFKVEVLGFDNAADMRFTEVSGLYVEMGVEEVAEGGENRFTQKFPTRAKYPDLMLKRGLLAHSGITTWIFQCIEDYQFQPRNVDVKLLNEKQEPLLTWHVINAFPTKWAVSDLNSTSNTVAIETLQLYYQYFRVDRN